MERISDSCFILVWLMQYSTSTKLHPGEYKLTLRSVWHFQIEFSAAGCISTNEFTAPREKDHKVKAAESIIHSLIMVALSLLKRPLCARHFNLCFFSFTLIYTLLDIAAVVRIISVTPVSHRRHGLGRSTA